MIRSSCSRLSLQLLLFSLVISVSQAFVAKPTAHRVVSLTMMVPPPVVAVADVLPTTTTTHPSTMLQVGVHNYVSTLTLSDKPTKEEIAQKRLTFSLWFWGGGIIAPFIATVFYFGWRFWEK